MTWQNHSPDMETDSLQTQTLGCTTGTAEKMQTNALNQLGFVSALLKKVYMGFFSQIQMGI